ncbi:MAG: ATP F0F1 synthase subunit B [Alphaproteobacteria bacterium]|nr:ATP F0F1 synthase subunit B [Alphaproteobacteria bacterium]
MATTETTESTGAKGGHESGAFPPLDSSSFPSQLFWLVIFFGALYFLMSRLVLPKLGAILATRKAQIDGDMARAQALKDETEAAVRHYEKALGDAKANANDIARDTKSKVTSEIDGEQATLDGALAKKIKDAEARVAKAKAKAMESVEAIAGESAADIVSSLTGGKTTKAAVAKAIAASKG